MNEEYIVEQRVGKRSNGKTIGVQNNYNGITPEKAVEITNKLFIDNFPKLQEQALELVNQRISELQNSIFERLRGTGFVNYGVFADPDMQYTYFEAQKSYARFGTDELLNILSSLIVSKAENSGNDYKKRVIDSAISIAGQLTKNQINYLTVTFLLKNAKFNGIETIEQLKIIYLTIEYGFSPINSSGFSLLNSLGCFDLNIGKIADVHTKVYGFQKDDILSVMPKAFELIPADYGASDIGKVIAITNANSKTKFNFNIDTFIV